MRVIMRSAVSSQKVALDRDGSPRGAARHDADKDTGYEEKEKRTLKGS